MTSHGAPPLFSSTVEDAATVVPLPTVEPEGSVTDVGPVTEVGFVVGWPPREVEGVELVEAPSARVVVGPLTG